VKTLEVLERVTRGKRVKEITKRHYREALNNLAEFEPEWDDITAGVINEWLAQLDGYADTTVKMWFNFVNATGKYMERLYDKPNPCNKADRPKVAKKRRRYFTEDEMVRVIQACITDYEKALILSLIDSTCRIGELVGLKGKDVGDAWLNVSGKTGQRRYRLEPVICKVLKEMAGGDDEPVFRGRNGEASTVSGLKHRVRKVIARAGITGDKCGAHTLRHSGASLVARETGSALVVKALLQHDKIDTSMQYIHDAEDVIQQKHSPLKMLGEAWFKRHADGETVVPEQLQLTDGIVSDSKALVPVNAGVVEVESEFELDEDIGDGLFPEIEDGKEVRPLLRTDDLRLMREIFVVYARNNRGSNMVVRSRELMKRIVRRSKVKV